MGCVAIWICNNNIQPTATLLSQSSCEWQSNCDHSNSSLSIWRDPYPSFNMKMTEVPNLVFFQSHWFPEIHQMAKKVKRVVVMIYPLGSYLISICQPHLISWSWKRRWPRAGEGGSKPGLFTFLAFFSKAAGGWWLGRGCQQKAINSGLTQPALHSSWIGS